MVKPNGFFFPSVPVPQGKRSAYEEEAEEASDFYSMLSNIFGTPDLESEMVKRDNFDESTFFAGRGKRDADLDADAFFAGRGKKDNVDADLAAFFAGRGKKGGNVGDIFFAGRG